MTYCETSAISGIGVIETFENITRNIVQVKLDNKNSLDENPREATVKL